MSPKEDETSLGSVLLELGLIKQEDLDRAVNYQQNSSMEQMLGAVLVLLGACSKEEIEYALSAQKGMRESKKRGRQILAMMALDAAIQRKRFNRDQASEVVAKAERFIRHTSGTEHIAITPELLAKTR
jgi:hypothetical protein